MDNGEIRLVPDQDLVSAMSLGRLAAQHPTVYKKFKFLVLEIERLELMDEQLAELLSVMAVGLNNGLSRKVSTANTRGKGMNGR